MPKLNYFLTHQKWLLLGVLVLVGACSKTQQDNPHGRAKTVKIDLTKSKKGSFSDLFSELRYILLESEETDPLVSPYQIHVTHQGFFIEDYFTGTIHHFDKDGHQIGLLKAKGAGPGEYQQLDHFEFEEDTLFVLDRSLRKLIGFNLRGQVNFEKKVPVNASLFYKKRDKTLFFMNNQPDQGTTNFQLYEQDKKIEESVEIRPGFEKFKLGARNGLLSDFDSGYSFPIPFSSEIAFFDKKLRFEKTVYFDFGPHSMNDLDYLRFSSLGMNEYQTYLREKNKVADISLFSKLGNYYFLSVVQAGGHLHIILMDKKFTILHQTNQLSNDFDEMPIRNIPWTASGDTIYIFINSVSFYNEYLSKFSGQKVAPLDGTIHDFFQKNQHKLKDDHTVLLAIKLKDKLAS